MSFSVDTSVTIRRTAVERLLRLPGGIVHRNLTRRTERVTEVARRLAPGSMADGIETSIEGRGRNLIGRIESTHPATIYVIKGTRPHQIRPVRAQALRFTVGGRVVFAQVVNHPGTRPNDFLTLALRTAL